MLEIIVNCACWGAALLLAWITASCLIRVGLSRTPMAPRGMIIPALILPALTGAGSSIILAVLGVDRMLTSASTAACIALAALPVVTRTVQAGRRGQADAAVRQILAALRALPATARSVVVSDFQMIAGRHGEDSARPVKSAGAKSSGGPPRWTAVGRVRNVPHLLEDPHLGAHPQAEDVAFGLVLDGVIVPPHWERTAQVIGEFEPENDEDMAGHMTMEAAGVLTVAAAVEARAEHLAAIGVDPILVEAHYDIAEGFADLAIRYALLVRRDHVLHGDLRDWVDAGGVLTHNARIWYQAGTPGDGDRAA